MVAMAGLQVFIVRFFFQGARKGMLIFSLRRLPECAKGGVERVWVDRRSTEESGGGLSA